ncbi:MAG: hypothetical protein IJH65_03365 [Methanobrevibacter sp.]|nr:hypothetical protein [Methanobrevibacter sp.]
MPTVGNYYAGIRLDSADRLCSLFDGGTDLDPEGGSSFYGLGFSSSYTDFPSAYLQILEDGQLCEKSFHKFNAETIFFGEGEGKSLAELFNDSDILKIEAGGTGASYMLGGYALVAGGDVTDPPTHTTSPITFRQITNKTSAYLLDPNSTNLVNEKTVYNALAVINNTQQSGSTNIYAPESAGSVSNIGEITESRSILVAQGNNAAPMWLDPKSTAKILINNLTEGTGTVTSGDVYIITSPNNGTNSGEYYRRKVSNVRVGGLTTGRTLQVNLASTSASTAFDGTDSINDIGVSGKLAVGNGGTGATTFTSGNLLVGNGTSAVSTIAKASTNTANAVVVRDSSGNFSAGTITASLTGHASLDLPIAGGTMTGILTAQNNTSYSTKQVRNIFLSTSDASGGDNGDIWITYVN